MKDYKTYMPGKTDLTDVTFILPLRIDSNERIENIDALIKFSKRI